MKLVFIDESGQSKNWVEELDAQPFHVLGAVVIDADLYPKACERLRKEFDGIEDVELEHPLGKGTEIKAKEISAGKGWWKEHNKQRNEVRELMLSFPALAEAAFFLVVIDKKAHHEKYVFPTAPHELAFQYMFERLQSYLADKDAAAICIYDQTKFMDDAMHRTSAEFMRDGSLIEYWSEYYGFVSMKFAIDRIKEFCLGRSENSIGLQVADYLAHFGYQYFKGGKPPKCGWWKTLEKHLYRKEGNLAGYGLKVFP